MKERTTILLLAALLIVAIPISSTLAATNAQITESRANYNCDVTQEREREQQREWECVQERCADCDKIMIQERAQLRDLERNTLCFQAGTAGNSSVDCEGFALQLMEMHQAKNQQGIASGR